MTDQNEVRSAGYDDLLDAIAQNSGYYLTCPQDHGWLPPRAVCPTCGARELTEAPLPDTGEVVATTTIHVAAPQFDSDSPYAVALVDMGPITITGQIRGLDPATVEPGLTVEPSIVHSETTGDRLLGFEPV